jgi:GAF domain-containing protein
MGPYELIPDDSATGRSTYPDVPEEVLESWQHILDEMTARMRVPVGLVMRVDGRDIEIACASEGRSPCHPVGSRAVLANSGLYCERVLARREPLAVSDAARDPDLADNPSLRLHGLRSYLGYPIRWPDGSLFGTICVMDTRERDYTGDERDVMGLLRDLIETNLRSFYAC